MKEYIIDDGGRVMDIDEAKEEIKKDKKASLGEKKAKFKQKAKVIKEWMCANQEFILGIGLPVLTIVGSTVVKGVRAANRKAILKQEKDLKELYCYDRSLGHYWKLKRPLKNRDWVQINTKLRSGEKLGDILNDMKVLN